MSYRDDHDAALLRVAALENEIAQLRKSKTEEPKPVRKRSKLPAIGLALAAVTGFGALMAAVHFGAAAEASPPVVDEVKAAPAPQFGVADLRSCLDAIQPVTESVNAASMDPRQADRQMTLHAVERSGAACRLELGSLLDTGSFDPTLRERLTAWYATENALANTISLITVYYGSNPIALDNYATAPQLWTEYHRAHHARDAAIEGLTL